MLLTYVDRTPHLTHVMAWKILTHGAFVIQRSVNIDALHAGHTEANKQVKVAEDHDSSSGTKDNRKPEEKATEVVHDEEAHIGHVSACPYHTFKMPKTSALLQALLSGGSLHWVSFLGLCLLSVALCAYTAKLGCSLCKIVDRGAG